MPYITTNDNTKLYVKDWGSGRPVILMHGWPLSADSWDDQAMEIAQAGFRTIAYDRRGFGRSAQPWAGYNYDTLADDLATVIEGTGATDLATLHTAHAGLADRSSEYEDSNLADQASQTSLAQGNQAGLGTGHWGTAAAAWANSRPICSRLAMSGWANSS